MYLVVRLNILIFFVLMKEIKDGRIRMETSHISQCTQWSSKLYLARTVCRTRSRYIYRLIDIDCPDCLCLHIYHREQVESGVILFLWKENDRATLLLKFMRSLIHTYPLTRLEQRIVLYAIVTDFLDVYRFSLQCIHKRRQPKK